MTAPLLQPDDALRDAASLTFAVIRFAEGAAHSHRGSTARGMPRLGEDAYVFAPSLRHVRREDVPAFLAGLPSAAMLFPTTIRGVVALQLLNELSGDRAAGARKEFANQRGGLEELAASSASRRTRQFCLSSATRRTSFPSPCSCCGASGLPCTSAGTLGGWRATPGRPPDSICSGATGSSREAGRRRFGRSRAEWTILWPCRLTSA